MSVRKRAFRPLLLGTLWLGGLLASFVFGAGTAYVVLSGVYLASRVASRRRTDRPQIESG